MDTATRIRMCFEACRRDHLETLKHCIQTAPPDFDPTTITQQGDRLIEWAARHGHLRIVKYLVEEVGASAQSDGEEYALELACIWGYMDVVKYFIENGSSPVAPVGGGDPPLCYAFSHGHIGLVKYLMVVTNGAAFPKDFSHYIHEVPMSSRTVQMTKYLVDEWKVDLTPYAALLAINVVTRAPLAAMREFISELKVDVKTNLWNGYPAFACVGSRQDSPQKGLEVLKFLIDECGIDVHDRELMLCICLQGQYSMFQCLVDEHGVQPPRNTLHSCPDVRIMKALVERFHHDPNERNFRRDTPLTCACFLRNAVESLPLVKYLVETCRVDVNAQNVFGHTALMQAAACCDFVVVRYLVKTGRVDVNLRNIQGSMAHDMVQRDMWGRGDEEADRVQAFLLSSLDPLSHVEPRLWKGA